MVDAAPFRALRYDPTLAGDPLTTSAPAYDDLNRFAYARHRTASPYTVLELMSSTGQAAAGPARFAPAAAAYDRWRRTGVLQLDPQPAFYRYEQHWLRHGVPAVQRGLVAAVDLADPLTHEHVDDERVQSRLDRLEAVPADLSPVFGLYSHAPTALRQLLGAPPDAPPIAALTDEDGVDHRVWRVAEPATVGAIRAGLTSVQVMIADGHHRFAAALALRERRRSSDPDAVDASWQRTLMHLVDTDVAGPEVRGVHRLVRTLPAAALEKLPPMVSQRRVPGDVAELIDAMSAVEPPVIGLLVRVQTEVSGVLLSTTDAAALRALMPAGHTDHWYTLGSAVLEHVVLPAAGVDPTAVAYRVDLAAAAREVTAGAADALFLLQAVPPAFVFAVAAAGDTLPAKTTWFYPKPRTGLLLRPLGDPH